MRNPMRSTLMAVALLACADGMGPVLANDSSLRIPLQFLKVSWTIVASIIVPWSAGRA